MAENNQTQTPKEKPKKQGGGAKKFFTSIFFKIILIVVLEFVSLTCFRLVLPEKLPEHGLPYTKQMLIYFGVCTLLSITTMIRMNNKIRKEQHRGTPGVIRIISQQQHTEEQIDRAGIRFAFMLLFAFVLSPFVAPFNVAGMIHGILCKVLK